MPSSDWLILVRCAPDDPESTRFQHWLQARQDRGGVLFFQAEGVEHAKSEQTRQLLLNQSFRMLVCQGSWQRRYEEPPPEPFVEGSLVEFFSALESPGRQLECFGVTAKH